MPLKGTDCRLPAASSVIVTAAVRGPSLFGLKVTLIVQCALGGRLEPQLLLSLTSPASIPLIATLLMFNVVAPLVNTIFCGALLVPTNCTPKLRRAGEIVIVSF